jgi:hypothetical protein
MHLTLRKLALFLVFVPISSASLEHRTTRSDAAEPATNSTGATITMLSGIQGSPPTLAQIAKFDVTWNSIPHRNICVAIAQGTATIDVVGMPNYVLYYVPKTYTEAREIPDAIIIATPDKPLFNGTVCLGIERQ